MVDSCSKQTIWCKKKERYIKRNDTKDDFNLDDCDDTLVSYPKNVIDVKVKTSNLINKRFWLESMEEPEEPKYLPNWVNLDKYEDELQKIEYKKAHKAEKLQELKDTLAKLKEYKKKFKAEGRDDMIEEIDKDIDSVQKELDELEK